MAKLKSFEQFVAEMDRSEEIEQEVEETGTPDNMSPEEAEDAAEEVQETGEEAVEESEVLCEATVEMDAMDPDDKDFLKFLKKHKVEIIDKKMDGPGGGHPVITMQGKRKDLEAVLADEELGWADADLAEYIEESVVNESIQFLFSFDYNTDEDDVDYIQSLLKEAGVDAVAQPGLDSEEMVVKAKNAVELRKAKKAIKANGFEIYEALVDEGGAMSDIDLLAKESKDFKTFVKAFQKEYSNLDAGNFKELEAWLKSIYDDAKEDLDESVTEEITEEAKVYEEEKEVNAEESKPTVAEMLKEAYESCKNEAKMYEDDAHDDHTVESYMKENAALVAALAANALKEMKEEFSVEAYEATCNEMIEAYTKKINEMKESHSSEDAEDVAK